MPGSRDQSKQVCCWGVLPCLSSSSLYRHFRNIKYARRPPLQMQCYWFGVNPQSRSNMIWYQQWLNETSPSKNGRRGERLSGFPFGMTPCLQVAWYLSIALWLRIQLVSHLTSWDSWGWFYITLATWLSSSLLKKKKALRVLKLQRWTRH